MSGEAEILESTASELFEDAPCGYLTTRLDGTVIQVNRTFEAWTGLARDELVGRRRFAELLSPGGRIYYETHFAPLLQMQGEVREIAVEIVRADGSKLAALVNAVLRRDEAGEPLLIRTTVFDATDRRRYEQELLRARRRERDVVAELQRSMLSGEIPQVAGLELGVAYQSAVAGLEVGGDWYDAFWLIEGESLGLVVGDVVGRGITASATMGQLRSAVRALAATGLGPGPLLDALDRFARRHEVGLMTTVAYAELRVATGELRFACAGHPPPLVAPAGEAPRFLWEGRSTPIAVPAASERPREEAFHALEPGTFLLLYSDGLIERRGQSLDEGMARLLATYGEHADAPATLLAETLVRELRDPRHPDDVCLLAARRE